VASLLWRTGSISHGERCPNALLGRSILYSICKSWRVCLSNVRSATRRFSFSVSSSSKLIRQHSDRGISDPSNSATTISFACPKLTWVTLWVYNPLSWRVGILVDEIRLARFHKGRLDGINCASGVYFDRLKASEFSLTRKLLVQKQDQYWMRVVLMPHSQLAVCAQCRFQSRRTRVKT
jgi:hypothetical protein